MELNNFIEQYNPLTQNTDEDYKKYLVDTKFPGCMVLVKHSNNNIWTLVQEDDKLVIYPDLKFKGKIANIITEKPWNNKDLQFTI